MTHGRWRSGEARLGAGGGRQHGVHRRRAEPPRGDLRTAVAIGVVFILAGWVWVSGEVAGRLATGQWPAVPPAMAPGIVARLAFHPLHWSRAWPVAGRRQLPGDALIAVSALGVLAVGGVAGILARRGVHRALEIAGDEERLHWRWRRKWQLSPSSRPDGWPEARSGIPPRRRDAKTRAVHGMGVLGGSPSRLGHHGARWASSVDFGRLAVSTRSRQEVERRLVLGRLLSGAPSARRPAGRLIATEARHSLLVLGPTQSGKTTGLAVPAILEWEGPVVATSVKDDLASLTLGWRARQGSCFVFDPTAATLLGLRARWSPLCEALDWGRAQRVAGWLVESTPARSGLSDSAFWFAAAAKLLAPLMLAANRAGLSMAQVVHWTDTGDTDEATAILDAAGESQAAVALMACAVRDERIRSSVSTTLETVLAPFADPVVATATAGADLDPDQLLGGANTLYLCGPSHEQFRVQAVFAALISSVVAAAVTRATAQGGGLELPLLLVLDEMANIAPVRDLDTLASTAAGLGMQLVTVCQDLAQLSARYGPERSRTIVNNHRAKLLLSGVCDLTTLELMSGLVGETLVREETLTTDLRDGRRTRSNASALRRLAPVDLLRAVAPGEGVLVYGHLPPARLALRPWYTDARLRQRVGYPLADKRPDDQD